MNFSNYRIVRASSLSHVIKEKLTLNSYHRERIEDILEDYVIMELTKPKKVSFFFRLTIPFYLVFLGTLAVLRPIKWILTGDSCYEHNGRLLTFYRKWNQKLGL